VLTTISFFRSTPIETAADPKRVKDRNFLNVVASTPLVSIDLIVRNEEGHVLLGKRTNRPAKGYWFVPGGRIRKNERIVDTFERISESELGLRFELKNANFLGVYEHLYDDNFFGEEDIGTHYVVLAYECRLDSGAQILLDAQHSDVRWWDVGDLLDSDSVHVNTKAYFD